MNCENEPLKPQPVADDAGNQIFELTAGPDAMGVRLDRWLSSAIEDLTRTRVKALIEAGAVTRNGAVADDPSQKIKEEDTVRITVPAATDPTPKGEAIPLDVVYEDDDLIIVNKEPGMVVHPAPGSAGGTLVNALIHHCGKSLSGIGGVARPGIVHRIDKDTSGLIVAAKNDKAHQGLAKAFSAHDISRVYEAIVVGAPRPGVGSINAPLARSSTNRTKMTVVKDPMRDDARHAITHYKVRERFGVKRAKLKGDAVASLVECRLETGRTHQIRVHFSSTGHPLIGDPVYGRGPGLGGLKPGEDAADAAIETVRAFRRQALHARLLGFEHPVTGESLAFERPAPADFQGLLSALRRL